MLNKKRKSLNHGCATVYVERTKKTDFNAKVNGKTLADFKKVGQTFFAIETMRQEDLAFAEALNKQLDLKISVPTAKEITAECLIFINGYMYDVYRADADILNGRTYLYLTGVRKF